MTYSIAEVAKIFGVTTHTLRYYDKEGLMPYVERSPAGIRQFKESDFRWLKLINCLKESGVPVKKIKNFVDWCMQGDVTIEQRLHFMEEHKKYVEKQMEELENHLKVINHKIWYYKTAAQAGTTAIHENNNYPI